MKHNEFCPIILEQNKKWNYSITAYCTCNKVLNDIPLCVAPTHTWEPLFNTEPYKWICKNCKLKNNL